MRCGPTLYRPWRTLQALYTGGSRVQVHMPAHSRVHQYHASEYECPTQLVPFSASESVTSHRLSGRLLSSASIFWFILITQRTPSSQRPQHVRARTSHRLSSVARTGRQFPSPSAPQVHGPTVQLDVRCGRSPGCTGRPSQCLFASSASVAYGPSVPTASERPSDRKYPKLARPSQTPVGRCRAASVPRGRRTNQRAPGLMKSRYQ
jgi:hypothetical protein